MAMISPTIVMASASTPSIMMTAATVMAPAMTVSVSVVTPIRPSRKSYEWKSIPENGFKSM